MDYFPVGRHFSYQAKPVKNLTHNEAVRACSLDIGYFRLTSTRTICIIHGTAEAILGSKQLYCVGKQVQPTQQCIVYILKADFNTLITMSVILSACKPKKPEPKKKKPKSARPKRKWVDIFISMATAKLFQGVQ